MTTKNVDKIRAFYEQNISTRLKYDSHPLKNEEDEYKKQLYCTMLAVIVQYGNDPKQEQVVLLERIGKGSGLEVGAQELLQKALLTDEKFAQEFYEEFAKNVLAQNFAVDALLLVYANERLEEKQLLFVTEILSVLEISEEVFTLLVKFTKAILTNSSNSLYELFCKNPQLTLLNQFEYYYAPILDMSVDQINKLVESKEDVLIFVNMHFTPRINFDAIENRQLILFKNCTFSEFEQSIGLLNVNSVIFDHCEIKNCKTNLFECHYTENLYLYKCSVTNVEKFKRTTGYSTSYAYGGILIAASKANIYVFNSIFKCVQLSATSSDSDSSTYSSGLICAGEIGNYDIQNNLFDSCKFTNKKGGRSYLKKENSLYVLDLRFENVENLYCSFINEETFSQYISKNYSIGLDMHKIENNEDIDCTPEEIWGLES